MNAPTNGRFTLQVWPGSYELFVSLPDIQGWGTAQPGAALKPLAFGRTSLEVRGNITGVAVTVRPGVDLKGRVTVDGRPASAGGFQIRLQPDAQAAKILAYQSIERFRPAIGADGSFVFPALPEARYEVRVETTGQASLSVADIQIDGKSVIGKSIAIGATSPGLLEIALKTESGK
jgi:hypothetical protein